MEDTALVIALAMVVAMALPALAEPSTGDTTGAPTSGSITINSPVVEATYHVYKIFNMTTNADVDAFSYTIDVNSPFYGAVVDYASDSNKGLKLARIKDSNPATYNVTVDEAKFDAQAFGKAMQAVLETGSPLVAADTAETTTPGTGIVAKEAGGAAIAETTSKVCTITDVNTSGVLKFENLDLGYFLINPTYPSAEAVTVSMGDKTFTVAGDLDEEGNFTAAAEAKIEEYVVSKIGSGITDAKFTKYLEDNGITTNKNGDPLNDAGKQVYYNELKAAMIADAKDKIQTAFANNASESDINVKEPILIFLDSSQPDATINEKNETEKWDIPVNPNAGVQPGQPDHGEPEGGKNIVVQEDPQYFADWSEAKTGESVHYQLRVNAMNFIKKDLTDDNVDNPTINQVKEYFLADYQSAQMTFDESKGLKVSVWQGDNENNSQASSKVNVTKDANGTAVANGYLDYTDQASKFFVNNSNPAKDGSFTADGDIFGANGTGIMVPWIKVVDPSNPVLTEAELNALKTQFPVYEITNVPVDGEYETEELKDGDPNAEGIQKISVKEVNETTGEWEVVSGQFVSVNNRVVDAEGNLLDENGQKIQKTKPVYIFNLYNSDVTIVVDYWMILDKDAIVDEPGNKNFAQYAWNPVDFDETTKVPKTPNEDEDKPDQKEKVDEATVYTFALAWVKTDKKGNELADAEFELPFYVTKVADKDNAAYVYLVSDDDITKAQAAVDAAAEGSEAKTAAQAELARLNALKDQGTKLVTTTGDSAVITIKGVEQGTYSITETKAPAGYNKLTAPFTVEAKKSGPSVTTTTKTIIYLDRDGNVTSEVTTATTTYDTDPDSYNNETPAVQGEETSVPVYQFNPIVNEQGTELPSTGGIGTTIFYVVGAILVIGAGIVLITRRRMDA